MSNVTVVPLTKKLTRTTPLSSQKSDNYFPADGEIFQFFSLRISNGAISSTTVLSQVQDSGPKFRPPKKCGTGISNRQDRSGMKVSGECFPFIKIYSVQQTWEPPNTQLATNNLFSNCYYNTLPTDSVEYNLSTRVVPKVMSNNFL